MTFHQKPLTGRKVLLITLAAFGVVFGANIALLVSAVGSFPGLEVKNSYVASQIFEAEALAQDRLGWIVQVDPKPGAISVTFRDRSGAEVFPADISATVGRLTHANADQTMVLTYRDGAFSAPIALEDGAWQLRLTATASDGTAFRQRFSFRTPAAK